MAFRFISSVLLAGTALALTACGGGGGGVNSTPPAPITTPAPPGGQGQVLIPAATTSQQFATFGASYTDMPSPQTPPTSPASLATDDQLQVRYDASTKLYQVQVPGSATWTNPGVAARINPDATPGYQYSALALWFTFGSPQRVGEIALGIPTPAGGVPASGTATYQGMLIGRSSESIFDFLGGSYGRGWIEGSIALSFDFGAGSLSGSVNPTVYLDQRYSLGTLNFAQTVYSPGSTSFSGRFDTSLSGLNSFSGIFTGPAANEAIGNFAFPYTSPVNGQPAQAAGAWVARH